MWSTIGKLLLVAMLLLIISGNILQVSQIISEKKNIQNIYWLVW